MRIELRKSVPTLLTKIQLPPLIMQLGRGDIITGVGLFGLFVALLATMQFATPNLVGNDSYFHIKFAQVMREQGLLPVFTWLPLTILNADAYFNHHFLYHVFLIPFTYGDLREGAKWAAVIFPAAAFLSGWLLLRGQQVPYAALWALGFLAVSEAFLYRMSMTRVQSVSLLMLFLILHVTLTQRYRWLLPLTFTYVWLYDGFPFIVALVTIYTACRWLLDRRLELSPLLYTGLGVGLGLLINPYFPKNIVFIYHHMLPKLTETTAINVGNEWYPYRTWTLVENSAPALFAFVAGVFALGLREKRMGTNTATLLLTTILFGFLLLKSRRFIEYYPAFALVFCALAWAPFCREWMQSKPWFRSALPILLILMLTPFIWYNIQETRDKLQDSTSYQRYASASAWLKANTPAESRVFQTDWDDFTWLYFHNIHNNYTLGLDPTYMQQYNPQLYDLWRDITKGHIQNPSQFIASTFGANYVITDLKHEAFLREAKADSNLEEVYRDEYAVVFRVYIAEG